MCAGKLGVQEGGKGGEGAAYSRHEFLQNQHARNAEARAMGPGKLGVQEGGRGPVGGGEGGAAYSRLRATQGLGVRTSLGGRGVPALRSVLQPCAWLWGYTVTNQQRCQHQWHHNLTCMYCPCCSGRAHCCMFALHTSPHINRATCFACCRLWM
jgi:hypothetical protein